MRGLPFLLFANSKGKIYTHPYLRMVVFDGKEFKVPQEEELISLPKGSTLFYLPQRYPVGFNPYLNTFEGISIYKGKEIFAVSCFLIPAYLRLYHPAYINRKGNRLPLWAYSPLGFYGGRYYTTAKRVDNRVRQSPRFYNTRLIKKNVENFLKKYPKNRLYKHLAHCALSYNCLAAKNMFLKRWEAPLPTSPSCNAQCLGCLSLQESDCIASHQRINFYPREDEIFEVAYNHLKEAQDPIVSFGQGCEGEPLLYAFCISRVISHLRDKTRRGTLHMNTNAGIPQYVKLLCEAGMDSFRVSINSFHAHSYNKYFNPQGYSIYDVFKSIEIMNKYNKFVSLNLLIFPGFTDRIEELKAMRIFLKQHKIDMIQLRNLNIDPDYYFQAMGEAKNIQGVDSVINIIKSEFPQIRIGYFNLEKRFFRTSEAGGRKN